MVARPAPHFRVVLCFRPGQRQPSPDALQNRAVVGLRVRTSDLHELQEMATWRETPESGWYPTPKMALDP
jgi:hypothetical protein